MRFFPLPLAHVCILKTDLSFLNKVFHYSEKLKNKHRRSRKIQINCVLHFYWICFGESIEVYGIDCNNDRYRCCSHLITVIFLKLVEWRKIVDFSSALYRGLTKVICLRHFSHWPCICCWSLLWSLWYLPPPLQIRQWHWKGWKLEILGPVPLCHHQSLGSSEPPLSEFQGSDGLSIDIWKGWCVGLVHQKVALDSWGCLHWHVYFPLVVPESSHADSL